jgi:hypothetical protein
MGHHYPDFHLSPSTSIAMASSKPSRPMEDGSHIAGSENYNKRTRHNTAKWIIHSAILRSFVLFMASLLSGPLPCLMECLNDTATSITSISDGSHGSGGPVLTYSCIYFSIYTRSPVCQHTHGARNRLFAERNTRQAAVSLGPHTLNGGSHEDQTVFISFPRGQT